MNFIVEKNFGDKSAIEAIDEVINSDGNHLIMAYGYIYESEVVKSVFQKIISFLEKSEQNRVSIFIGLFFDKKQPDGLSNKILDLDEMFKILLPDSLFSRGVSERIAVYGIKEFHAKFSIMYRKSKEGRLPVAALTGSSNLTFSALKNDDRFELDVLMLNTELRNPLIESFSNTIIKMLKRAVQRQDSKLGEMVEERIHWKPLSIKEIEIMDSIMADIASEKQKQEFYDLAYYTNSAESKEDGIAMHESDIALGISSEYEKD